VGQRFAGMVEGEQARDVHDPLAHLPPLGLPGNVRGQLFEQGVGAAQPARQEVDPGAVAQRGSTEPVPWE